MNEEHSKIIKKSIDDAFEMRDKFYTFSIESSFQLLISQLDLFKTVSGLVVAFIGIGYFYRLDLNKDFLLLSLIFSLITLVLSISYSREAIDLQEKQNQQTEKDIVKKTEDIINKSVESLEKNDSSIFFNYARERLNDKYPEPRLNYIGEIILFCFYLSIGFMIFSWMSSNHDFKFLSLQTTILLTVVYLISFKDWSKKLSEIFSKKLT